MRYNKTLFHLLSFTWGILTTLCGCIVALAMLAIGHKPHKFCDHIYFKVGKKPWGGLELGWIFFLTDCRPTEYLKRHEVGHSLQACIFGPLMPFVVSLPSIIRYWYREIRSRRGLKNNTGYYDIWFEKQASDFGEKYLQYYKENEDA